MIDTHPVQSLAMPLVAPLIKAGAAAVAERFLKRNPLQAQQNLFMDLIRQGTSTRFGREHGFRELQHLPFDKAYQRYQREIPIRSYEDFWNDYIGPCYTTEGSGKRLHLRDVTWPGRISLFCETSGTTAPTKYIPFSREMFRANRRAALDLTACYLGHHRNSRLLQGRFLYMSGSTELSSLGENVLSGDMSAITLRFAPSYLKPFVFPPLEISSLPWDEKLDSLARLLLTDRWITGISGVPPWILLLLQRCRDMGKAPVSELLPNLELIIHGGTSLKPYRQEFEELFAGRTPNFLEVLPSSEAFMGFQVAGEPSMRLTPYYGAYFEFVPFDRLQERGKPAANATAIPLEDVREGERYAVILSTCAGLWRYHIGDTIRFTSRSTLAIEFTGRDRFLDRFEEKVTQSEVEQAITNLGTIGNLDISEFMVGPDISGRRHIWVVAMKDAATMATDQIANFLDVSLQGQNADYATFRRQARIKPPVVIPVAEDMIYRWSKEVRGKLGGQSKIPHIDPTLGGEMLQSLVDYSNQTQNHTQAVLGGET